MHFMQDPELPHHAADLDAPEPESPRYMYDPDAPRHARLRIREFGFPEVAVGVTDSGTYAVIADPGTPSHLLGHALDYADRLAELIPEQRPAEYVGKHRAREIERRPGTLWSGRLTSWALILMITAQAHLSCTGAGFGV